MIRKMPLIIKFSLFTCLYMAMVILDRTLYLPPLYLSALQPSIGVFIAFLLLNDQRFWPLIVAILFAANSTIYIFVFGSDITGTFLYGLSDVVVCISSAWLTHKYTNQKSKSQVQNLLIMFLICILVVPMLIAAFTGYYSAFRKDTNLVQQIQIAWSVKSLGVLYTLPLLIYLFKIPQYVYRTQIKNNPVEVAIVMIITLLMGQWVFGNDVTSQMNLVSEPIIMLPLLIWTALRLSPFTVCIQLFMVALIVLGNACLGSGPFFDNHLTAIENILVIQGYLAIIGLSTLSLAIVVEESRYTHRKLEIAVKEADKANKSKSELFARASHELRTPLNAIIGFSSMILMKICGPIQSAKYNEYVADINDASNYLLQLVNNILDLSKMDAGEHGLNPELIASKDWLLDLEPLIKTSAQKKNIQCNFDVSENLPQVYADRRALRQILINIFTNAIKFTPEDGAVTLTATKNGRYSEIIVSDTGIGVSTDKIDTITTPFMQAGNNPYKSQEGTGLGLAIVKSLVELHQGKLKFESNLGEGFSVKVYLPLEKPVI